MVKNILLDLDDTLLDFKKAEAIAIRDAFVDLGIEPSDENVALYSKINRSCWAKLELGEYTRDEVLHKRFDMLFSHLGIKGDSHEAQKIYERNLSKGAFYLPGAKELLDALFGKYNLYLATNGIVNVQTPRIESSGIGKYFADIFVSEKIGYNKPDKRFFNEVFAKIEGFDPDETIIVGDGLESDIKGGLGAGIKTVYFNPRRLENATGITPNYEINSHAHLLKLLEEI